MATCYVYKRPITNSGAIQSVSMTEEEWKTEYSKSACFAVKDEEGDIHDYSEFVSELQLQHNDIDGDEAGRSKCSGARMKRSYLGHKHTINIKMVNHLSQGVARKVFKLISTQSGKTSFEAWFQSPCGDTLTHKEFYCSTVNYGSQRYDRNTGRCYYDGMNFNIIEM